MCIRDSPPATPERPAPGAAPATGVWIGAGELAPRPTGGPAWESLRAAADRPCGPPRLRDQDDDTDVLVLAKALVHARTGAPALREEVRRLCLQAIGTERGGDCLALGRNLPGYVIAADLVGLEPADRARFDAWLRGLPDLELKGRTLRSTHEDRPNNWGTHAGGSRAAIAAYLGDAEELGRVAAVFRGWLGDRASYAGFRFGDRSWQADPAAPVGVNPAGATRDGRSIDGVLPDDQRRGGPFTWPPPRENYVYEALQGALLQAVVLHRRGYDVWSWEDHALVRAYAWLHGPADYPASGDDTWQTHVINHYAGTEFPAAVPSRPGKNLGWTDWTHGKP